MNPWWGVCCWQIDRSSFRVQPSAKTWHGTVAAHITRPWNTTIVGHPTQRETLSFDLRDAPPDNDITEFTSVSGMSRRKISLRPLNYETGTRLCVLLCEGRIDFIDGNEIEASLIRRDQLQIFLLNCHWYSMAYVFDLRSSLLSKF